MRKFTIFILNLLFAVPGYTKTASITKARVLADHYFSSYSRNVAQELENSFSVQYKDITVYHVFNYQGGGFVVVAASDAVTPILAQSNEGFIDQNITNPAAKYWFESYSKEIVHIISANLDNTETLKEWNSILSKSSEQSIFDVGPLLTTEWDQGEWYNYYCPVESSGPGGHAVAGCVATSMAQIMKFYNFPKRGFLSHSYEVPNYGNQTANFAQNTYNWDAMGKTANSSSYQDIAMLIYYAGVSTDMNYSLSKSGASSENVPLALTKYFNYDPSSIKKVSKVDYTDIEWNDLLKSELQAFRPVYYVGYGVDGHAWVCDGWQQSSDMFHMNWGWSGKEDGWYRIGQLNTISGSYNKDNEAVIGIKPGNPNLVVRITNLNHNQLIACNSSVTVDCSVLKGTPNAVNLYVDNIKIYTTNQLIFKYNLLTKDYTIGTHIIKVEAVNSTDTSYHEVTVRNSEWISQASAFSKPSRGISYMHAVDSLVVWATAYDESSGFFPNKEFTHTENGGETWKSGIISGCDGLGPSMIFALNSDTVYCPMYRQSGTNPQGIYLTVDGGNTWNRQTSASFSDPASFPNVVHFFDQNNGFCMGDPIGGEYEIYTTVNAGVTWTRIVVDSIPNPLLNETGIAGYYSAFGDKAWFGTTKGRVYWTNNRGKSWNVSTTTLSGKSVDVEFADQFHGLAQDKESNTTGTLSETFDGGISWKAVNITGQIGTNDFCFVPGTENTWVSTGIKIGSTGNALYGVFYSYDGGHSWFPFELNKEDQMNKVDFVSPETGWASGFNASATAGGMFRFVGKMQSKKFLNPVTGLIAKVTGKKVSLEWNAPATDTFSGYNVYRNDTLLTEIPVKIKNYNEIEVAYGTQSYCVAAVYPTGESEPQCADAFIMSPIKNLLATVTDGMCVVKLKWDAPPIGVGEFDVDYYVYRNDVLLEFCNSTYSGDCPFVPLSGKQTYCVVAKYKSVESEAVCTDAWIPTGISEYETDVVVYPNPANEMITIETSKSFNKVFIYNLLGQEIYYYSNPENYLIIPTTEIPPGIYILQIDIGNKTDVRKISIN